jgi:short-subunit dehydrogenase
MANTFSGRVVLITGASSGIGEALAREFARQGAVLALLARRTDRLARVAADVEALGATARAFPCDVTDGASVDRAMADVRGALGPVSVVVANAGFGVVGPVERLTLDDYRRQFETNVFGVLHTVKAALDDLKQTRGQLVLIGSVAGHISMPNASPYSMSKFAVHALAQSLRHELGRDGVSVTLISPGFVESEIRQVDNRGVRHADTREPVPAWLLVPTTTAARDIVSAVARRKHEAVITAHGKALVFAARHAPWLVDFVIRRAQVRSRREPQPSS